MTQYIVNIVIQDTLCLPCVRTLSTLVVSYKSLQVAATNQSERSETMQAPDISIIYFPVRARAECARMILAYSSIPYTDTDCQKYFGNIYYKI